MSTVINASPSFNSSTTNILMSLVANALHVDKKTPGLPTAAILSSKSAQVRAAIENREDIRESVATLANILEKLKIFAKQSYLNSQKSVESLIAAANGNRDKLETIVNQFNHVSSLLFNRLKNLLQSIATSRDPDNRYGSADIQNQFKQSQKELEKIVHEVNKELKTSETIGVELKISAHSLYLQLPQAAQINTPNPIIFDRPNPAG